VRRPPGKRGTAGGAAGWPAPPWGDSPRVLRSVSQFVAETQGGCAAGLARSSLSARRLAWLARAPQAPPAAGPGAEAWVRVRLSLPARGSFRTDDSLLSLQLPGMGEGEGARAWRAARGGAAPPAAPDQPPCVGALLPPLPPPNARPTAGVCGLLRAAHFWSAWVGQRAAGGRGGGPVRLWLAPAAGGALRPALAWLCCEEGRGGEDEWWF